MSTTEEAAKAKMNRPVLTSENREAYMAKVLNLEPAKPAETTPEVKPETKPEHKPENPIQARISEVVGQRNELRQQMESEKRAREAAEKELAELRSKAAPPVDPEAKPDQTKFTDPYQYAEALANWSASQAVKKHAEAQAKAAEEAQRTTLVQQWQERQATFASQTPDYADVVGASEIAVSDQVRDAILESDMGPQILYHLAAHPEEGRKIAAMDNRAALRALGRMEVTLAKSEPKVETKPETKPETKLAAMASKAPAPITPIATGTATNVVPLDDKGEFRGSYAEWKQNRRSGKI
jgi:hypothetical protein